MVSSGNQPWSTTTYCQYNFRQGRWRESTRGSTPPWSRWNFQRSVQWTKAEKKYLTHFPSDEPSRGQPQSVSHVEESLSWNSPAVDCIVCTYFSQMECHTIAVNVLANKNNCKGCGKTQQATNEYKVNRFYPQPFSKLIVIVSSCMIQSLCIQHTQTNKDSWILQNSKFTQILEGT